MASMYQGKSAYQSYLDTTTDNPPLSEHDWANISLGYVPENVANKITSGSLLAYKDSTTKYPSVKSLYDWTVGTFVSADNVYTKTQSDARYLSITYSPDLSGYQPINTAWNTSNFNPNDYLKISDFTDTYYTKNQSDLRYEQLANKGIANGYAALDSAGKLLLDELPTTILQYVSTWDASTNTPTLINPDTDKKGYVYVVTTAGTQFGLTFAVGDWLVYNSSGVPEKVINSNNVVSVNGYSGVVVLDSNDIGAQTHDSTLDALSILDSSTGFIYQTGADTFVKYDFGGNGSSNLVARADHTHAGLNPTTYWNTVTNGNSVDISIGMQSRLIHLFISSTDWTKTRCELVLTTLVGDTSNYTEGIMISQGDELDPSLGVTLTVVKPAYITYLRITNNSGETRNIVYRILSEIAS